MNKEEMKKLETASAKVIPSVKASTGTAMVLRFLLSYLTKFEGTKSVKEIHEAIQEQEGFTGSDQSLRTKLRTLRKSKKAVEISGFFHTPIHETDKETFYLKWLPNSNSTYGIVKVSK